MIEFRRDNEQKQISITTVDELEFYTQASARGDHLAETLLGEDYAWGYDGIPENTALGINLLRKAADSGQAVNPDGIRLQIAGGIIQSASWTLNEAVAFDRTRILSRGAGAPCGRAPGGGASASGERACHRSAAVHCAACLREAV